MITPGWGNDDIDKRRIMNCEDLSVVVVVGAVVSFLLFCGSPGLFGLVV